MSHPLGKKRMRYNSCSSSHLDVEGEPAETKNLMILNDHCLLEMFTYLKPSDLANVVRVNKRFNALISTYFLLKHGLQSTPNFDFAANGKHKKLNVAKAFLRIFGYQMVALNLSREFLYQDEQTIHALLSSVQKYCTNLKELTIKGFKLHGIDKDFFKNLHALTLDECFVNRDWCKMKQLKTLTLNKVIFRRKPLVEGQDTSDRGSIMSPLSILYVPVGYTFPSASHRPARAKKLKAVPFQGFGALEEVRLTLVNLENDCITKLIESNSAIKRLSVVKCVNVSSKFFADANKLEHLVEFEFKDDIVFDCHLAHLFTMKKLQTLKFTCRNFSAFKLLDGMSKNGIAIEHLELGHGQFDDATSELITKMSSIKVLKLNTMANLNHKHLSKIAKSLDALEELHLQIHDPDEDDIGILQNGIVDIVRAAEKLTCLKIDLAGFKLDHVTHQAILNAVQSRMEQTGLELTVYDNGDASLLTTDVLNENGALFSVCQLNRNYSQLFEGFSKPSYSSGSGSDTDYSHFDGDDDDEW